LFVVPAKVVDSGDRELEEASLMLLLVLVSPSLLEVLEVVEEPESNVDADAVPDVYELGLSDTVVPLDDDAAWDVLLAVFVEEPAAESEADIALVSLEVVGVTAAALLIGASVFVAAALLAEANAFDWEEIIAALPSDELVVSADDIVLLAAIVDESGADADADAAAPLVDVSEEIELPDAAAPLVVGLEVVLLAASVESEAKADADADSVLESLDVELTAAALVDRDIDAALMLDVPLEDVRPVNADTAGLVLLAALEEFLKPNVEAAILEESEDVEPADDAPSDDDTARDVLLAALVEV
jgi:hypothetical protein